MTEKVKVVPILGASDARFGTASKTFSFMRNATFANG